jgi:hypothetical protein
MDRVADNWRSLVIGVCVVACLGARSACAEAVKFADDATDGRIIRTVVSVKVDGKIVTLKTGGMPEPRPLKVDAGFEWQERRLAGTGRDAKAFRSVRWIERARSEIVSGEQTSYATLRPAAQLIVAQGQPEGVVQFSPSGPLTAREMTFLAMPGDPLLAHALLPENAIEPGDSWKPSEWVVQSLTLLEASQKSELECKLEAVKDGIATVTFTGNVEGLTSGAAAKISLQGKFSYDLGKKLITRVELTQKEQRAFGPVSPGLDVSATVTVDRSIDTNDKQLGEASLKDLPLEPNDANQLLAFDVPPWGVELLHGREWHLFQQTPAVAIFRQVKQGNLVSQMNIQKAARPADGKPLPLERFEADVKKALDKNLKGILQTQEFQSGTGLRVLRVIASGEAQGAAMQWHYHWVSGKEGDPLVLVFVVEPENLEQLGTSDLEMIESLVLKAPLAGPSAAAKP